MCEAVRPASRPISLNFGNGGVLAAGCIKAMAAVKKRKMPGKRMMKRAAIIDEPQV
jgi:hypothetical protein